MPPTCLPIRTGQAAHTAPWRSPLRATALWPGARHIVQPRDTPQWHSQYCSRYHLFGAASTALYKFWAKLNSALVLHYLQTVKVSGSNMNLMLRTALSTQRGMLTTTLCTDLARDRSETGRPHGMQRDTRSSPADIHAGWRTSRDQAGPRETCVVRLITQQLPHARL